MIAGNDGNTWPKHNIIADDQASAGGQHAGIRAEVDVTAYGDIFASGKRTSGRDADVIAVFAKGFANNRFNKQLASTALPFEIQSAAFANQRISFWHRAPHSLLSYNVLNRVKTASVV